MIPNPTSGSPKKHIPLIGFQSLKGKQFVANGGHSNDLPFGHFHDLKIKFSKRHSDPASIWTHDPKSYKWKPKEIKV